MIWLPWVLGGALLIWAQFIEVDETDKIINQILGEAGSVIFYDKKTKTIGVKMNIGSTFNDLVKLKEVIANAIQHDVDIIRDGFKYFIKLVEPSKIPSKVDFEVIDTTKDSGMRVAVAVGCDQPLYIDFLRNPHTLIAGATGWGKSVCLKSLILQILGNYPDSDFELLDFKGGVELSDFKNLVQTKSFTIKPDMAVLELSRIYEEIEYRLDELNRANVRDWVGFNKGSQEKMKPKFVIIEEFTILIDQDKDISNILTKSLAISRAAGVYFIFTSQRFDSKIIDSKIKANIDNRICFHTADSTNSKLILDTTGAEQINVVGRCLISAAGEIQEGQSFYTKENDVQNAIKSHLKPRREDVGEISKTYKGKENNSLKQVKTGEFEGVLLWE